MISTYKKHSSATDQGSQQSGTSLNIPRKQEKKNGRCVRTETGCRRGPVIREEGLTHLSPTGEMASSSVYCWCRICHRMLKTLNTHTYSHCVSLKTCLKTKDRNKTSNCIWWFCLSELRCACAKNTFCGEQVELGDNKPRPQVNIAFLWTKLFLSR